MAEEEANKVLTTPPKRHLMNENKKKPANNYRSK